MIPQPHGAPLNGSDKLAAQQRIIRTGVSGFIYKTFVIAELELRKLRHDPTQLFTRAVQPALWLLIFGQVFTRIRAIPTGDLNYLDFMTPGILAQIGRAHV